MRKLFSFFAAMLIAVTASATVINISPTSPKDADNLRLALNSSTAGDTIVMAAGTYVESNSDYIAFKRHNVVMAAEEAEVIIKPHVPFRVRGGARAELNGVKIDASELTSLSSYENIFEVGDATAGNCWVLKNCEVYGNSGKTLLRHASDKTLDSLIIEGCYVHNNPQAILRLQSTTLKGVIIKNSTFAEIANGGSFWCAPMDISKTAEDAKVIVDQCTFYHNTSISTSYADITTGVDGSATSNVVVSNCIIAQPEAYAGSRAINFTNGGVVKNCLVFNYTKSTNGIQGASSVDNCIYVDPLFADAENANYTLDEENSPAKGAGLGGTHLGDPRWWPASWQPAEVIDVTGIELDKSEISLEVNEVELLSATVSPDDATDPTVFWSSSDPSVVTVSGGFITAKAAGSATITATAGEKEATCAVTVVAATIPDVDFSEPCVLSGKKAHLEGAIWKNEDFKLYGDGSHNQHYGNAFWTINVTHPCIVSGVLNGVEGGHMFALDLYQGEDSIGTIAQVAAKLWSTGEIAMDSTGYSTLTIPEAGEYTLRLRNTQEWSSGKVAGITLTHEYDIRTLYCKVQQSWWTDGSAAVGIYAWGEGVEANAAWPGVRMEKVKGQAGLWSITLPSKYTSVAFTRLNPSDEGDLYWGAKTEDLVIPEDKDLFTITTSTSTWDPDKAQGEWSVYVPETPAKFYITGNDKLVGEKAWSSDAVKVTEDSYTFENLPIGDYVMKITVDGTWGTAKGYEDLTTKPAGLKKDNDGNICFKMREVGDITVTYTDEVFTVEGDFYVQRLENDFYLVGEFNGEEKWSPAAIDENYRFVWNSGEGDKAEFKVVADLTVGDKLKAVYIYEDEIVDWYPDGSDNEYVVDALHDGAGKTVYFRKDYSGTDWGHNLYIDQRAPKTYYGVDTFTTGGAVINPSVWRVLEWSITRNANKTLTFNISWNEDITGIVPQLNLGGFKNMAVTGYSASLTTEATYEDGAELTPEFYLAYAGAASSIPVSYTVGAENEKPNAPVGNLEINFMTDPKTIISGNGVLPTGVEIEGTWHGDSHGYNGAKVTMYVVAGNYKITVGNCEYSNNSASAYIKNADESAALNLIDANGQTISSITAKDGCYHQKPSEKIESAWFVAEEAQTIKFIGAEYTPYLKFEKVESVPQPVTVYNVTFDKEEGVEGTLPAAQLIVDGESLTIPVNRTLYKEGYTLTGWSDGVETFEAGQQLTPTEDVTLTAVFTANGADLLTFTQDITVQWDLTQKAGAPAVTWQNREGDFIVTQAIAGGARLDVKLDINTKPGKFAPQADWCQVNAGTTFTFPSKKDATFEVRSYVDPATSTLDGNAYNGSWVNSIATFSTTNTSGTSVYVSNESGQYYSYFKLTLPKTTATTIDNANANANAKATKSIVNGMLIIEKNGKTYNVLGAEVK